MPEQGQQRCMRPHIDQRCRTKNGDYGTIIRLMHSLKDGKPKAYVYLDNHAEGWYYVDDDLELLYDLQLGTPVFNFFTTP